MKFGLAFASSIGTDPESALAITKIAAEVGFESVWGGEHVIFPSSIESPYPYSEDGKIPATPETPIPDPLIWLAYVAAAAPTLRLGTCILILPQRNPLVLAKELATLDHLSGGRVELGIGVGWMKEEFDALGVPWQHREDATTSMSKRCAQSGLDRMSNTTASSSTSSRSPARRYRCRVRTFRYWLAGIPRWPSGERFVWPTGTSRARVTPIGWPN